MKHVVMIVSIMMAVWCCSVAVAADSKQDSIIHLHGKNADKLLGDPQHITHENGVLRCYMSSTYEIASEKVPAIGDTLTVAAWVAQQTSKSYRTIAYRGKRNCSPEKIQFCFDLFNGSPEFKYKDRDGNWRGLFVGGGMYGTGQQPLQLAEKEWHHVAATFDNGTIALYVNGEVVATAGPTGQCAELIKSNEPLLIGAANPAGSDSRSYSFDGLLNGIRIVDKCLPASAIKSLYEGEKKQYPTGNVAMKHAIDPELAEYDPQFKYKLRLTREYEKNLPADTIKGKATTAHIAPYKGGPALFIDNKPLYPMQMMPSPWSASKETFNPCRDFAAAGVDLYSDIIYSAFGTSRDDCKTWWQGEGKYDYSQIDKSIKAIIDANPRALILLRIKINPPSWWQKQHPDDISTYHSNGKVVSTKRFVSLASEAWETSYERMLRDIIRYIESTDYAGHIYGYSPAGGYSSEWFWYSHKKGMIGYSKTTRRRFQKWLKKQYNNDVAALRQAWQEQEVTFDSAGIPSPAERAKAENGLFIDPLKAAKRLDFRTFLTDVVTSNVIKSSRICKEETKFKKLTSVFYGYSLYFEGNTVGTKMGNNGFQGLDRILKSPYIDSLCSPTDYDNRRGGEPGLFISAFNGSYRLHNKLFWDEADYRTHLYEQQQWGRPAGLKETKSILQRAFGYSLSKGTALWWFLIGGNANYHQNGIMEAIARMQVLGNRSMVDDKTPVTRAALIIDENSMHYTRYAGHQLLKELTWGTYTNAVLSGAPFDVYLQSDVLNGKMPDYKLYIFANSFFYDQAFCDAVKQKLAKNNAIAVWTFAPGYITGNGFSTETMERLTGIKLAVGSGDIEAEMTLSDLRLPITGQCRNTNFKSYALTNSFYVDDPEAQVLGTANGKAVLAVKNMGRWKSVYSMMPLTKELLQGLLDYAGIHVYSRSYDVLYANSSYIMLHSGKSGVKSINLPGNYTVTEILSGKEIGRNISRFSDQLAAPQTKIYRLTK